MEWYLQWGTAEYQRLFKMLRDDGTPHTAELTKPALRSDLHRYYDAYRSLSASRIWSQIGPTAIQISEVRAYLDLVGIEDPQTKMKYLRLIQGMDQVEVKHIQAKQR